MKNIQNAASSWQRFPKKHRLSILSLATLTMVALLWRPSSIEIASDSRKPVDMSTTQRSVLGDQNSEPLGEQIDSNSPEFSAPKDELEQEISSAQQTHRHVIAKNELLGSIFEQYGLTQNDMYSLIAANRSIERINPGMTLEWSLGEGGKITELKLERNVKDADLYTWEDGRYHYERVETQGEMQPVLLHGRITDSFYNAARSAGLSEGQIITIAKAMQWKFDLGRQAKKGDRFAVQLEREFIDGKAVGRGEIKALLYQSGSREYAAIQYQDGNFYDEKGQSLARAFDRLPTSKRYRISSPFNPNRKHPVTGRIAPHNGTDFATPIGTPIYATGDGVVVKAQKHALAGNYVVIKHGREYMTRFLHLHRILVKKGDTVTRGQKIALSGNTGRSTGPHLHYELIKNSRPVNAMKVPLPQASPVPSNQRTRFVATAESVLSSLRDQI
ncbi:murein DD-endopeptidase MepM [Vibrio tapetis]|uniref:Putative Cell wall endopeptidase, family M23 n=1 Tax=Vibrio tapetis subsp. tapetis TaxID=1671868 RepID=A0A2N8ZBF4_9VIBR|nr:murein DD-endopeptidase MepM [Vibrio tapetis]SON49239.1 putative Cell wall endopeptidase, family M23 [Vibrio tapetis subsp. tapetis]